jgi:hypothetical protein
MRIYVSGLVQHSVFSSGHATATLQIAEACRLLGHDVSIINILDNKSTWYDDALKLAEQFKVLSKSDFIGPTANVDCIGGAIKADLLIDVIGCLTGADRAAIASKTVLFVRNPAIHFEIENAIYPISTIKRCYDNISEIWTWELYGSNDFTVLSLLGRCNVRSIPYIWSPFILEAFQKESGYQPWHIVAESVTGAPWTVRCCETNITNRSSCVIPMTIMKEFTTSYPDKIKGGFVVHNGLQMAERQFFKENLTANLAIKPETQFVGRNRITDWCMCPRTIMLAHCRFTPVRWTYIDAAYLGIPMIHNSQFMKRLGGVFERYYYSNNSISEGKKALRLLLDDFDQNIHAFRGVCNEMVRKQLCENLTVVRPSAIDTWRRGLESALATPTVALYKAITYVPESKQGQSNVEKSNVEVTFRIQFLNMWDQFQVGYNFFTLLMDAYMAAAGLDHVKVVGCGSEYTGKDIHMRIFGPYNLTGFPVDGIPNMFTTCENVGALPSEACKGANVVMQTGFSKKAHNGKDYFRLPIWMMSMDWFGADNDKLVNPRVMPVDWLTTEQGTGVRPKFCSFVVTNPNNPVRNAALDLFGRIGHVDSAGRYRNNCGDAIFAGLGGGGGERKKVEWLRQYRFSITYENGLGDGYVTEKLFHAKAAGCVPIYWGDAESALEDFQKGGFIVANGKTDEQLLGEVQALEADESARLRIASTPLLSDEQVNSARRRLAEVATALMKFSTFPNKGNAVTVLGNSIKPQTIQTVRNVYGRNY